MLFNKYQYQEQDIIKRGYSHSCEVFDEDGKAFWAKWILGINKGDTKSNILADKLKHLQKARHIALPEIIEFGYDEGHGAYAIVNDFLRDVDTLEARICNLNLKIVISGLIEVTECLQELHIKHKITHGDITPANILIDGQNRFYIVDFGLHDITRTLSQESNLEIFARAFAAPEKLNANATKGFAFQSDIYSFGKVIEWCFASLQETPAEKNATLLGKLFSDNPASRPSWNEVIAILKSIDFTEEQEVVQVAFRNGGASEIIALLNSNKPTFNISADSGKDIKLDVILGKHICEGVYWVKSENKLLFNDLKSLASLQPGIVERKIRESKSLPVSYGYTTEITFNKADLTPYLQKWYDARYKRSSLRENRKEVRAQLSFYKDLLKKEKEIIELNSLRLRYHKYKIDGDEIWFYVSSGGKFSDKGFITKHIEEGNAVNSEGISYLISSSGKSDSKNDTSEFGGKPYDFNEVEEILKIKDCEGLKKDDIPQSGYLLENIKKKTEEKDRQLQAISAVERNEVQNPNLIYYLFKPDALPPAGLDNFESLDNVKQKSKLTGKPIEYSYNQIKAIKNALNKGPLTVIQGPPGTGKTTVITEIVFQLLALKPEAKILITSQTNNAVDQVLENLLKNEIPIVRLSGFTSPKIPAIRQHTLERKLVGWKLQVKASAEKNFKKVKDGLLTIAESKGIYHKTIVECLLNEKEWKRAKERIVNTVRSVPLFRKLIHLPEDKAKAIILLADVLELNLEEYFSMRELHLDWLRVINSLDEKSAINQKLIDSIRVVGATCNHIAAKKYKNYNFEFDYVIMDESGKATVAEALVPITMGNNLVFVGDHRQLKPMLTSSRQVESWLREEFKAEADELENWDDYFNRPSLFEEVIKKIDHGYKAQLTECRRSSVDQIKLTSKYFYEDLGDEEVTFIPRDRNEEHNLPLSKDVSILFVDIGSLDSNEKDENGSSFNQVSANTIFNILERLNRYDLVKKYSIGVITGYTAQKKRLDKVKSKCQQKGYANLLKWGKEEEKLSVSVFDRFQGLERDIMIVDLVKSGPGLNLGFLEVPNRINVALSRQKRLLIVVGDYSGIVNATTRRLGGNKAALQKYLAAIDENWIVKPEDLQNIFK